MKLAASLFALAAAEKPRTVADPAGANTRTTCGGTITADQTIKSPGFDTGYYYNNLYCSWIIDMPDAENVVMIPQRFDLESNSFCRYDRIELHRPSTGEGEIARYCGYEGNPYQIGLFDGRKRREAGERNRRSESLGPMWGPVVLRNGDEIAFKTDGSVVRKGFQMKIVSNADQESVCGQSLTGSGAVSSPGFWRGDDYPENLDCEYTLNAAEGHNKIKITITHFHLEHTEGACYADRLIIDGQEYCGDKEHSLFSFLAPTTDDIIIDAASTVVQFQTDDRIDHPGFRFEFESFYEEVPVDSCIQNLSGSGVVTSQNFPAAYELNSDCEYTLNAEEGKHIKIRVTDFEVEDDGSCAYDFLEIDDQRYCGESSDYSRYPAEEILIEAESTVIRFSSDDESAFNGFRFEFESVDPLPPQDPAFFWQHFEDFANAVHTQMKTYPRPWKTPALRWLYQRIMNEDPESYSQLEGACAWSTLTGNPQPTLERVPIEYFNPDADRCENLATLSRMGLAYIDSYVCPYGHRQPRGTMRRWRLWLHGFRELGEYFCPVENPITNYWTIRNGQRMAMVHDKN